MECPVCEQKCSCVTITSHDELFCDVCKDNGVEHHCLICGDVANNRVGPDFYCGECI